MFSPNIVRNKYSINVLKFIKKIGWRLELKAVRSLKVTSYLVFCSV